MSGSLEGAKLPAGLALGLLATTTWLEAASAGLGLDENRNSLKFSSSGKASGFTWSAPHVFQSGRRSGWVLKTIRVSPLSM